MKQTGLSFLFAYCRSAAAFVLAGLFLLSAAQAEPAVTEDEAYSIGVQAYLYFYPLVTMEISRKQFTNVAAGKELGKGPMNTFTNVPEYPPADFKGVVRPNFDTLYSVAWLDLTKEPVVVSVPETGGRYYLLPMPCGRTYLPLRAGERLALKLTPFSSSPRIGPANRKTAPRCCPTRR
jgi:hypothetical protein